MPRRGTTRTRRVRADRVPAAPIVPRVRVPVPVAEAVAPVVEAVARAAATAARAVAIAEATVPLPDSRRGDPARCRRPGAGVQSALRASRRWRPVMAAVESEP